ncbi:MAG: tetratricopeptide repeat protein [Thermoplasmata archaeon]
MIYILLVGGVVHLLKHCSVNKNAIQNSTTSSNYTNAQQEVNDCIDFDGVGDYQRAIQACNTAIKLYPKNFTAYLFLGYSYHNVGEFDLAIKMLKNAEQLAGSKIDLTGVYNELGEVYDHKGDLDKALIYYDRAFTLSRELGNTNTEAPSLNNIVGIYHSKGDLDKALNYDEKSLNLTTNERERTKATVYNNIASIYLESIYLEKNNYQKSIEYFKKSAEISERAGDYRGAAMSMLNLGNAYRMAKNYNSALSYINEGLTLSYINEGINEGLNRKRVGDKYWEAAGYEYLGWYYSDTGNIKSAKEYLTKAYKLFSSIGANAKAYEALSSLQALNNQKTK